MCSVWFSFDNMVFFLLPVSADRKQMEGALDWPHACWAHPAGPVQFCPVDA